MPSEGGSEGVIPCLCSSSKGKFSFGVKKGYSLCFRDADGSSSSLKGSDITLLNVFIVIRSKFKKSLLVEGRPINSRNCDIFERELSLKKGLKYRQKSDFRSMLRLQGHLIFWGKFSLPRGKSS